MKSFITSMLPDALQDLLKWIPSQAWKAIDWKPLAAQAMVLSARAISNQAPPAYPPGVTAYDSKNKREEKANPLQMGNALLTVYFNQLKAEGPFFLDLRAERFAWDSLGQKLQWKPNGFWVNLNPSFRHGLGELYQGFYRNNPDQLKRAAENLKLIAPDGTAQEFNELKDLLQKHFGVQNPGQPAAQQFSLSKFRESFHALFSHMLRYRRILPSDFAWLGVALLTLYSALEDFGCAYDVAPIYLSSELAS